MLKKILIFFTVFGVILSNFSFAEENDTHNDRERKIFKNVKMKKKN